MDFGEKPDRDRESRDRKLLQLIEKCPRQVVFFIDDAHKLPPPTLTGLKTLVEKKLCVVLIGHPRLGYTVRDIAYDYSVNAKQVNRFLDGKLPADDPVTRQIAVFLKSVGYSSLFSKNVRKSGCSQAGKDILAQNTAVLRYGASFVLKKRAQKNASFSGISIYVLAPLHLT